MTWVQKVVAIIIALLLVLASCCQRQDPPPVPDGRHPLVDLTVPTAPAPFTVTPGVEQVTVTGAAAHQALTLVDRGHRKLLTLLADDLGQAVFAYLPTDYATLPTGPGTTPPTGDGQSLDAGDGYTIRAEQVVPNLLSSPFRVLGRDDHPPTSLYDGQALNGVHWSLVNGRPVEGETAEQGFGYVRTRDGVALSVMVRFPDPLVYGPGPYPTVVEYSGYAPSNPARAEPGSSIATSAGFASVGVNLRGTGCSGGVFDVFNTAQQADGYDVIETIARQPWVLHHKVGMVGLSYSGITQLYTASTGPPSLAAITPLSVIEDPWKMSWPGGIYNAGFTKQWLEERDRQSAPGGQGWDAKRIEAGDATCAANQQLRTQNIDFETFARSLEFRPADTDRRDLSLLVKDITVPVYLSGAWQDEQTGPRFATMLGNFTGTDNEHFVLFNGHHPDGYAPQNLSRWLEFLQLYVAQQVPKVPPLVRFGGPAAFEDSFGVEGLNFEPDRFTDLAPDQVATAQARWKAEPMVTVRFEEGAGMPAVPGAPLGRFEATFPSWPPPTAAARRWYLDDQGALADRSPGTSGVDTYRFDPTIGMVGYSKTKASDFVKPLIDADWRPTADGTGLSYLTAPLAEDLTIAGPGYASLWFRSDAPDADIEVVLSEVRPDGVEVRIQNGLLRAGHRQVDTSRSTPFSIQETFSKADYRELPAGRFVEVEVPIFPVADVLRAGSRLRLQVNTPGGDLPLWFFELDDHGVPDAHQYVARGGTQASSLVLPVLPVGTVAPAPGNPPCPSLRGQVCRPYVPLANATP